MGRMFAVGDVKKVCCSRNSRIIPTEIRIDLIFG